MTLYLTEYLSPDGRTWAGPYIAAGGWAAAERCAEAWGLRLVGEWVEDVEW